MKFLKNLKKNINKGIFRESVKERALKTVREYVFLTGDRFFPNFSISVDQEKENMSHLLTVTGIKVVTVQDKLPNLTEKQFLETIGLIPIGSDSVMTVIDGVPIQSMEAVGCDTMVANKYIAAFYNWLYLNPCRIDLIYDHLHKDDNK